jgi:hypothetical protein
MIARSHGRAPAASEVPLVLKFHRLQLGVALMTGTTATVRPRGTGAIVIDHLVGADDGAA